MNVIMSPKGPVVIDWTNAAGGPAGFDGAMTYVEIATFGTETTVERVGKEVFARAFRTFRGRRTVNAYIGAACDHRLADPGTLPEERIAVATLRKKIAGRGGG